MSPNGNSETKQPAMATVRTQQANGQRGGCGEGLTRGCICATARTMDWEPWARRGWQGAWRTHGPSLCR